MATRGCAWPSIGLVRPTCRWTRSSAPSSVASAAARGRSSKRSLTRATVAGGAALLITATTDNRNRTVAEVRAALTRGGGSLGETGSVAWNFESRGILLVRPPAGQDSEEFALTAIDAGADDFNVDNDELEVLTDPAQLEDVRRALVAADGTVISAEVAMIPKAQVDLPAEQASQVVRLVERLDDLDDVARVYSNVRLSDEVLAQVS